MESLEERLERARKIAAKFIGTRENAMTYGTSMGIAKHRERELADAVSSTLALDEIEDFEDCELAYMLMTTLSEAQMLEGLPDLLKKYPLLQEFAAKNDTRDLNEELRILDANARLLEQECEARNL